MEAGMIHTYISPDGQSATWETPDPEPTPEQLARESALAKLQALGLTEAEAMALVGN
jgi:hypothetical protein